MLSDLLKHIHDGCGIFTVGVGAVCVGWILDTGVEVQTCTADGQRCACIAGADAAGKKTRACHFVGNEAPVEWFSCSTVASVKNQAIHQRKQL